LREAGSEVIKPSNAALDPTGHGKEHRRDNARDDGVKMVVVRNEPASDCHQHKADEYEIEDPLEVT
jgi:hypothetical protein